MAATKILRCYPDYGKAPPEYVVNLMEALERYPIPVIAGLADVQKGLPGRVKFLPTLADVAELGRKLEVELFERDDIDRRYQERQKRLLLAGPQNPDKPAQYRPFPLLYDAFADEPRLLHRPFDTLAAASKALTLRGKAEALAILEQGRDLGQYHPRPPRFDISDFTERAEKAA